MPENRDMGHPFLQLSERSDLLHVLSAKWQLENRSRHESKVA